MISCVFFADQHKGSKYLDKHLPVPTKEEIIKFNMFDLGDSHDIKGVEPEGLYQLKKDYAEFKKLFGDRHCAGNHNLDRGMTPRHYLHKIGDKVLMITHSDYQLWGEKKALKFRNEKEGQGSGFIQKMIAGRTGSLSKSEAKTMAAYASAYGANVIAFGHGHYDKVYDIMVNGVRVLAFPKGKSVVYI